MYKFILEKYSGLELKSAKVADVPCEKPITVNSPEIQSSNHI